MAHLRKAIVVRPCSLGLLIKAVNELENGIGLRVDRRCLLCVADPIAQLGAEGPIHDQGINLIDASRLTQIGAAQERLEDVTRLVSDWIWETGPDLVLNAVSPRVSELLGGVDIRAIPLGAHPLMDGVQQLRAVSDLPASHWRASASMQVLPLAIAQRAGGGA